MSEWPSDQCNRQWLVPDNANALYVRVTHRRAVLCSLRPDSTTPNIENIISSLCLTKLQSFKLHRRRTSHPDFHIRIRRLSACDSSWLSQSSYTQVAATLYRRQMEDISQLDGSDAVPGASTQGQLVSALKEHLKSALLVLGALDQSTFSDLSMDEEYKDSIQRLLTPLTSLPLSSVVDRANEVLRSGLDAISARMSTIVDSPHLAQPPAIPPRLPRRQSKNASANPIPTPKPEPTSKPQPTRRPPPTAPSLPLMGRSSQFSPLASVRNGESKAQDVMLSIHFLSGSCRRIANIQSLVYSINANIHNRTAHRGQSNPTTPPVIAEARISTNGDRIVFGINPGTVEMDGLVGFMREKSNYSAFRGPDSTTYVRRGGIIDYVVRINNIPKRIYVQCEALLRRETEEYLATTWGEPIKLTRMLSPLIYLCEGPKVTLDRFCAAPAGSFDLLVEYGPGSQGLFPGVKVEGLCLSDVFDFV